MTLDALLTHTGLVDCLVLQGHSLCFICLTGMLRNATCWLYLQELNDRRLTLVEGSALSERDLVRTRAHSGSAILLLADRFSPSSHQEDLGLQFQVRIPCPLSLAVWTASPLNLSVV